MARVSRALAAARSTSSARAGAVRRAASRLLDATANPEGPGLLLRGDEYRPRRRADLEADSRWTALAVTGLLRLARLASTVADDLHQHPDPAVRRAAAILAARAHPILAGLDD